MEKPQQFDFISTNRVASSTIEQPIYLLPMDSYWFDLKHNEYLEVQVSYVNLSNTLYNINDRNNSMTISVGQIEETLYIDPGSYTMKELVLILNGWGSNPTVFPAAVKFKANHQTMKLEIRCDEEFVISFRDGSTLNELLGLKSEVHSPTEPNCVIISETTTDLRVSDLVISTNLPINNTFICDGDNMPAKGKSVLASLSVVAPGFPFQLQSKENKYIINQTGDIPSIQFFLNTPDGKPITYRARFWAIRLMVSKRVTGDRT
jgi:hypothetical protein